MRQRSNYTVSCKPIHGFTLIELLVVIAIIALLLSIIMPALNTVKRTAQGIVCQTNLKTLCLGWFMYHEDNNGYFVGADAWGTGLDIPAPNWPEYVPSMRELWCQQPQTESGNAVSNDAATLEEEKRGIRRGALYPFVDETKVYHCLGDRRAKMYPSTGGLYRTYSIVGGVNGQWNLDAFLEITRSQQLSRPSEKYIMVEEAGRTWNQGSWVISVKQEGWVDIIAMWHNKNASLGFADGHSEMRKWRDKRTIEFLQEVPAPQLRIQPGNPDLEYMIKHFPHREN